MKSLKIFIFAFIALWSTGCNDMWLDREPFSILVDEQVWNDEVLVTGVLSNFYDRLPAHYSLTSGWTNMAAYNEATWSGNANNNGLNSINTYGINRWTYWDYGLIRDINLAIDKMEEESELPESTITALIAELRFIRAYIYFEMVKRMGGIPLVTEQLIYDFSGDVTYLQVPRSTEEEAYDFIASELDEIADQLGNLSSKTRANKYTALALKSRAMLYAASIARYNNMLPVPIETDGGEVGISASRADEYYQLSLEASQEILTSNRYRLYTGNSDLGENFYEVTMNKSNNPEVIWAQDFSADADKRHGFAYDNIARPAREDNLSSSAIGPVLELVEDFEYLDGSTGELKTRTEDDSDYIYYDELTDIFENKDARLFGTVVVPGSDFRGIEIFMQAGVMEWDSAADAYNATEGALGSTHSDDGVLTALGGPSRTTFEVSNTGFYLRKYVSNEGQASTRGVASDNWWVRIRLGEIYLNAAEAAFELGQRGEAAEYLNTLRERAGFAPNFLMANDVDFDLIRNERRVELAFEDHNMWDLMRWRIAHEVLNGDKSNPGAYYSALYPYRVIRPGDPEKDGKFVFEKMAVPRLINARFFQMSNYYSEIPQNAINNNPKLVRNPFH